MRISFLRPLDVVVLLISLAVAVCSVVWLQQSGGRNEYGTPLVIINSPDGEFVYPLEKNREVTVSGLLGDSVIVIADGRAYFKESPCPNQTCVQTGSLVHDGDWAACLPNQIFIHIENKSEQKEFDAVSS